MTATPSGRRSLEIPETTPCRSATCARTLWAWMTLARRPATTNSSAMRSSKNSPIVSITRSVRATSATFAAVAIPGDGSHQAVVEFEDRLPLEALARLRRRQVLMLDLVRCLVSDVGDEIRPHQLEDLLHELRHRHLLLVREVESFPAHVRPR